MFYEYDGVNYNLSYVSKIQHLKGYFRDRDYHYTKEGRPETRKWFGLLVDLPAIPPDTYYYYCSWFHERKIVTKEKALHKPSEVKIWFVNSDYGAEWDLDTEEEALRLIELCKQSSPECKFVK